MTTYGMCLIIKLKPVLLNAYWPSSIRKGVETSTDADAENILSPSPHEIHQTCLIWLIPAYS